ncbi:Uncharacterised protein [Mycobacteroides abscessus]|nr:Uncharacterised protein [Mycobacteroides abscessus]
MCGEPLGEGGSAGRDADQDDAGRVTGVRKRGLFDDLMRDTRDGPADICGGQQFASFNRILRETSFSASLDGSLKDVTYRQGA